MKKTLLYLGLILLFLLPGCSQRAEEAASPAAPELTVSGKLILQANPDNTTTLLWNGVPGADGYRAEFLGPNGQILSSADTATNTCTMASAQGTYTISITCYVIADGKILLSDSAFTLTDTFTVPKIDTPQVRVDPITARMMLDFSLSEGCFGRLYKAGQTPELLQILDNGHGELPLEEGTRYYLDAYYDGGSYLYYSLPTEAFEAQDSAFGEISMNLSIREQPGNHLTLSWEQGQNLTFRLEEHQEGTWKTIYEGENSSFTTDRLTPHREYRYRLAVFWNGREVQTTEEVSFTPETNVVYATAWPIQTLNVYSDTEQSTILGTIEPVTAVCVLEQSGRWFQIRYGDSYGYILSDLCMVNLPEYLGDLCQYDIVNSYASLFHIHGYEIPEITGEVCVGYENVRLSDGSFLVPYLYPAAQRLEKAAESALSQGYILKIYDSYRPRETTIDLYNRAGNLLYTRLPDGSDTYYNLMTLEGTYALNFFLAPGGSRHNMGIALDLTMVELSSGQELQTQTSIHDLSWYSVLDRNTADAKTLSKIMKGAGFADLFSEWWHFSDAAVMEDYELPFCYDPVSAQCWVYDGTGWRYRTAAGEFYTAGSFPIEDTIYTFDEQGYVTE